MCGHVLARFIKTSLLKMLESRCVCFTLLCDFEIMCDDCEVA